MTTQPIPRIIHQTWRTHAIPAEWVALRQTWLDHHPDWEYRLWTDEDNRALVASRYPTFLPVYDAYPHPIMRADAVRYLLLHQYGGVYADLDYLCLRPLDRLLDDQAVALGLEPDAHVAEVQDRARGVTQIVGNALMASSPGHPFWEHVLACLTEFSAAPSPLTATGPFLLTRAYRSYPARETMALLPAALVAPLAWREAWAQDMTLDRVRALAGDAYAVHLWHGTWRRQEALRTVQARRQLLRATSSPSGGRTGPGQTEA
jgi:mannosyltransferase OCH1-like enzyme